MPHIHTEPGQIDQTVTAYIVRLDGDEPRALLHMHRKLAKLLPVGGHIELDETPWAALAHELEEESGYALEQLSVLQPKLRISEADDIAIHPQPLLVNTHAITPDHYHTDMAYLLTTHQEPMHQIGDGESSDLRWLTREEVIQLSQSEIWDNTRATVLAAFDSYMHEWESIPATDFSTKLVALK